MTSESYDPSKVQQSWWTIPETPLGPRCQHLQKVGFSDPVPCDRSAEPSSRFCFSHQPKPPLKRDAKGRILPRERTVYEDVG